MTRFEEKGSPMKWFVLALLLAACGDRDREQAPPAAPTPPTPPVAEATLPTEDEACAQVIVVAWQGAEHAAGTVTRTEDEARARAEELADRLESGAPFADLARAESDAAASGPRGGLLGTYRRDEWPPAHAALTDTVFTLGVGQTSEVLRASYGYAIVRRCPVEKVHVRHILVRYSGARNAPPEVVRARDAARILAEEIRGGLLLPGADFAAVARQRSEDASKDRGGDLGSVGRGRMAPEFEAAAFALAPSAVSEVIETEFGYHVIQRLE